MVIGIRKCARGGPLLPVCDKLGEIVAWEQSNTLGSSSTPVAAYLRELFARLKLRDVCIFDAIDGLYLVPYQAVLKCAAWERIQERVELSFATMRTAYRRFFGGTASPRLDVGNEPKLMQVPQDGDWKGDTLQMVSSFNPVDDQISSCDHAVEVPVRGTFVHFGPRDVAARPRCDTSREHNEAVLVKCA